LPIWVYIVIAIVGGCCLLFAIAFVVSRFVGADKADEQSNAIDVEMTRRTDQYGSMPDDDDEQGLVL
jgi:uncharacterized membrane protein YdjX (TVP38/TMEM64 family)